MLIAAAPIAARPIEGDVRAWLERAIAMLWLVQLVPWLIVVPGLSWRSHTEAVLVAGSYGLYCGGALWSFVRAQCGRQFGRGALTVAVAAMAACELAAGLALPAGAVGTWANWTPAPSTGVAVLARVVGGPRAAVGTVLLLGGIYAATGLRETGITSEHLSSIVGVIAQLAAFTYGTGLITEKLQATARRADEAADAMLEEREAKVRVQERIRQYELLHTTVLTTLTLIARSDGEVSPELRARCSREAEYLRAVVRSVATMHPSDLEAALAEAVFAQGALGLKIHHSVDGLPNQVPAQVIEAVAQAVREALNNVVKHAGVTEAWVVAVGENGGGLQVVVTDRGHGFGPGTVTAGVGLSRSLGTQVFDAGGTVAVRSRAGEGTSVEIMWHPH